MILLKNKNAKPSEIKGNYINIKDGYKTQLQKLVLDGRSTQETTNGDQLYDVKDVLTFSSGVQPSPSPDYPSEIESIEGTIQYKQIGEQLYNCKDVLTFSSGVTTDNDDWITISCDNTSGTSTKFFDFKTKVANNIKTDTKYDIFIEIKSVSGNGAINFVSNQPIGQSATYSGNSLANLSVGTIKLTFTTKDDFTGCTSFLNSYATFSAGQSGSITFRISCLKQNVKTTDNFVYEPYKETILNINLQGNKLCSLSNGVKDELVVENGRAKIIKNVQEDLLDGVNKKFTSIDLRGNKTFLTCNYANKNIKNATSENEVIPLSNKFRPTSAYNTWNGVVIYGISQAHNGTYLQFSFPKTIGSDLTLAALNTWLVNNNTKVQYQLKTPQIIDLGEVTQPKTFEGVNNISNSEDTNMLINYYNAFEFDKILRSGYEIDEQENEIFKKKMANGHRKKIVSSYIDCIIKINLGLLDNKTYQEYKGQLEEGEYEYWSYKYNQYKKANFILTKPSITTEYAYDDEIGIDDMEITLEKSSDVS